MHYRPPNQEVSKTNQFGSFCDSLRRLTVMSQCTASNWNNKKLWIFVTRSDVIIYTRCYYKVHEKRKELDEWQEQSGRRTSKTGHERRCEVDSRAQTMEEHDRRGRHLIVQAIDVFLHVPNVCNCPHRFHTAWECGEWAGIEYEPVRGVEAHTPWPSSPDRPAVNPWQREYSLITGS